MEHLREVRDEVMVNDEKTLVKKLSLKTNSFQSVLPNLQDFFENKEEICLPNPCRSRLLSKGIKMVRLPYPSNDDFFFECDSNGIMQTRKCPSGTKFNGYWCLEEKIL